MNELSALSGANVTTTTQLYVIRVWEEAPAQAGAAPLWRAWVEDPRSGQRWGFADAEAVLAFLRERIVGEEKE